MKEVTSTEFFEIEEQKYGITAVFLENALSFYIYEDKPTFGTFGVAVPTTEFMKASTLFITGQKNESYVRMIGERLATKTQKLVVVSLNVQDMSNSLFMKLIEKIEKEFLLEEKEEESTKNSASISK